MTNENINIRKAVLEDYDAVCRIMNQVQKLHVQWRPDIYKSTSDVMSKDFFQDAVSKELFYVAEINSIITGVLGLEFRHIESPLHVTREVLFIDSMAVDEAYRGKGIGHTFFSKLKEIAMKKNCDGIELQVNVKKQYASAGNLNTRISIHQKYSTNKMGFGNTLSTIPKTEIRDILAKQMMDDVLVVPKEYGMFCCRKD
ncbi:MAG: GNAT family N-acetyltransferase [Treponema sp.]|nr:GNAT family N-acetyltransferase [Treponema sp.]